MYSTSEATEEVIDTFAARTLPKEASSIAPDMTLDYMQRTKCDIDTLCALADKKENASLFIV